MIQFRPATPADLELLRFWDAQPHVMASNANDDWAVYRLDRADHAGGTRIIHAGDGGQGRGGSPR